MKLLRSCIILAMIGCASSLQASHILGGNITYECLGNNNYEVTLQLFRGCGGAALIPQDVSFVSDCGTSFTLQGITPDQGTEVSQLCPNVAAQSACNGGNLPGVEVYNYVMNATLSPCSDWTISWSTCCRGVSNNLVGTYGTYIEATLNNGNGSCNDSPIFNDPEAPYVCENQVVNYNMNVSDTEGDAFSYQLIDARFAAPAPASVQYQSGFSGAMPATGMTMDPQTGTISFTPTTQGNIFVVVEVTETDGNGVVTGKVMRDITFVVIACPNSTPDPSSGAMLNYSGTATPIDSVTLELCPGQDFCFDLSIPDADSAQTVTLSSNVESVLNMAVFQSTAGNPATANICWTDPMITSGSFSFTVTAEDDACPLTSQQSYAYTINVLSPADTNCITTQVNNLEQGVSWSAYPNPTSESIFVTGIEEESVLTLLDLNGKVLMERTVRTPQLELSLSGLSEGVFILQMSKEEGISQQRIVKY